MFLKATCTSNWKYIFKTFLSKGNFLNISLRQNMTLRSVNTVPFLCSSSPPLSSLCTSPISPSCCCRQRTPQHNATCTLDEKRSAFREDRQSHLSTHCVHSVYNVQCCDFWIVKYLNISVITHRLSWFLFGTFHSPDNIDNQHCMVSFDIQVPILFLFSYFTEILYFLCT